MGTLDNPIDKLNFTSIVAKFITALILIIGARYAKNVFVLILKKLYEFFIQRNIFKL